VELVGKDQAIGASTESLATGGETIAIKVISHAGSATRLEVTSNCYPFYDWGRNRQNLLAIV
jgi:ribosomal protein L31